MEAPSLPRALRTPGVHILSSMDVRRVCGGEEGTLGSLVDEMGKRSARAQGLKRPITTWVGLKGSDNRIVLSVGEGPTVRGLLRVGERQLFVRKAMDAPYSQISPTCVLDFYVHESCQRTGDGKRMFDAMCGHEQRRPAQLGYDRPSSKLLAFCAISIAACIIFAGWMSELPWVVKLADMIFGISFSR